MTKRYGIIGCGMMGTEHIANVNLLEGASVAAVFDPVPALAEAAAQLAGGAQIMPTLADMLALEALDALVIVSPNFLHVDQLVEIAKTRTIPILCEKPLYTRPEDEARIRQLKTTYPGPIWVAMEYRYMPPIAKLITDVEATTGGVKMLTIREHRVPFLEKVGDWNRFNANTGGTLVEKCCHFFDLMRLITKSEPVRVMASAGQIVNHVDECYHGQTPDIWDGGYVLFDFANGARALLELCMFADGTLWNEEISAVGAAGKIECRLPGPLRLWPVDEIGPPPHSQISHYPRHPKRPQTRDVEVDETLLEAGDHHGSTFYQHKRFLKVVRGEGEVEVTLDDGARAVRMGLAAQTAAQERRVVELDETCRPDPD